MREVAAIGLGMHPWGKFKDKSVNDLCRVAVEAALKDAGVAWREVEAVSAASSRFSGGKGWGLNGNDVVEEMGSTGVPVYNLSAGCAAGANAFNIGYTLVASGQHDVVLVVGGEKMPKGFIQTSGIEEHTDPEFLRDPYPTYAALRDESLRAHGFPLGDLYPLARYADCVRALRNPRRRAGLGLFLRHGNEARTRGNADRLRPSLAMVESLSPVQLRAMHARVNLSVAVRADRRDPTWMIAYGATNQPTTHAASR